MTCPLTLATGRGRLVWEHEESIRIVSRGGGGQEAKLRLTIKLRLHHVDHLPGKKWVVNLAEEEGKVIDSLKLTKMSHLERHDRN